MDDKTKKILEKIKKCFALSKSANANEAAVALKQAYALARKYNLENKIEALCQITSGKKLPAGNQINLPLYLATLLNLINQVFHTRSLTHVIRISDSQIKSSVDFYGYASDILIAEYAWEVLSTILIRSRTNFLSQNTAGRMKKTTKTRRADLYCLGWIYSVYEEVKMLGREISEEERNAHAEKIKTYQCLIYNNALAPSKIKESPLATTISLKEHDAYKKGLSAGKNVAIAKGVHGARLSTELLS